VIIGKMVENSEDMMIPNARYYHFYPPQTVASEAPARSLRLYESKSIGATFLVSKILQDLGVSSILNDVIGPNRAETLLTIAEYMTCRGNIIEYIGDWCNGFTFNPIISPQNAALLFSSISFSEQMTFFKAWRALNDTSGFLAYDVTSLSTYAKGIGDAEYGYNRDGDKLPQINLGCYLAFDSRLPIFYVTYPGSIVDKTNMPYIMKYNKELDINDIVFVMDRGFCTTFNMKWLHAEGTQYVMAVDSHHKTTRTAIDEVRDSLVSFEYQCGGGCYGRILHTRCYGVWTNMYIFYSPSLRDRKIADLYRKIGDLKSKLEYVKRMTPKEAKTYSRFFDIKIEKNYQFTYEYNFNKIKDIEKYCGYFCICSNTGYEIDKIYDIYKNREIIEKNFDDLKNHIDMKRMRTHNDKSTNGKLFCAFISLIAISKINEKIRLLNKKGGLRRLSKRALVSEMEKIKVVKLSEGPNLMNALTKTQRESLEVFGIDKSELDSYALSS
jgi:transposase